MLIEIQFISNQCALDVSVISESSKKLFKNVTLQILIFIPVS